jgi:ketosteroid isomerase-like protein
MADAWRDALAAWVDARTATDECRELDDGRILALVHLTGRGKVSGLTLDRMRANTANVFEIHEGRVARLTIYWDRDRALADLGLEEQAVSQENVGIVERAIAAINARDIDAYLACCTENVELLIAESVGAQYLGADGIRRFFTDIEDTGPDFRIEVQRLQALGDSHALAFIRVGSTGRASGIATSADSANVYDFDGGKISRVRIFLDRDEALKAVGLEE